MKILIVSDIHGNWPALRTVLESEPDFDRLLCLGDLVNFGPQPAECVAWAKEIVPPEWLIQGNHDSAVAFDGNPRCSPIYARLAEKTQRVSERLLTSDMKQFLGQLRPMHHFELGGTKCAACHAIPSDPLYGYLPETAPPSLWALEIVTAGLPNFLFLGHTHVPMKMHSMKALIVNPGSVGLPTNGDPRAAYAIWKDGDVSLQRVAYDVEETVQAYSGLGLEPQAVDELAEALRTGKGLPVEDLGRPLNSFA
jgi:predicted phosphodiesterase